jgi:ribosomal protein L31
VRIARLYGYCNTFNILYNLSAMKSGIHAAIHQDAKTTCLTCKAVYLIPSTLKEQSVENCRACHPAYTGKAQQEAKGGRVERFRKMQAAHKQKETKAE